MGQHVSIVPLSVFNIFLSSVTVCPKPFEFFMTEDAALYPMVFFVLLSKNPIVT